MTTLLDAIAALRAKAKAAGLDAKTYAEVDGSCVKFSRSEPERGFVPLWAKLGQRDDSESNPFRPFVRDFAYDEFLAAMPPGVALALCEVAEKAAAVSGDAYLDYLNGGRSLDLAELRAAIDRLAEALGAKD